MATTSLNHQDNKSSSVNDRIENCESVGRKKFHKAVNKIVKNVESITFTDTTARYDSNVETDTKSFIVEIKVRTPKHNKYDTVILKKNKYDFLVNGISEGFTPLYVNFYSDNVCLVWNLETAKIVSKRQIYVRKTEMNSNSEMEWQEFVELSIDDARKYYI